MCYSLWYNAPTTLPAATGRQHRGIINKPLLLRLVGVYIIYIFVIFTLGIRI